MLLHVLFSTELFRIAPFGWSQLPHLSSQLLLALQGDTLLEQKEGGGVAAATWNPKVIGLV